MRYFISILSLLLLFTGGLNVPRRLYQSNPEALEYLFSTCLEHDTLHWDPTYQEDDFERICSENYFVRLSESIPNSNYILVTCLAQMTPANWLTNIIGLPQQGNRNVEMVRTLKCTCDPRNVLPYSDEMYELLHEEFHLVENRRLQVLDEGEAAVHNGVAGINIGVGDEADNDDNNGEILDNRQNENVAGNTYAIHRYFHLKLFDKNDNNLMYKLDAYWTFDY